MVSSVTQTLVGDVTLRPAVVGDALQGEMRLEASARVFVHFLVLRLGSDHYYYYFLAQTGFPLSMPQLPGWEDQF